jgi:integrase
MARPNKPRWFEPRRCFRSKIDGKDCYFPRSIGRYDKPMMGDVPRAAWDYLDGLLKAAEGKNTPATDPSVYWLVQLYLKWAEQERDEDRLSPGQYSAHRTHLTKFVAHKVEGIAIGNLPVRSLTVEHVEDFFDEMRVRGVEVARKDAAGKTVITKKPASEHYIANLGKSIRAMLNWGANPVKKRVPSRLLADNPLRGYTFPRQPGAVRGYVDGAVVRRFLRWAWARSRGQDGLMRRFDRLYVLMLWFQRLTGCRPGEAVRLEWSEIDWDAERVVIPAAKTKSRRSTKKDRKIHATAPVLRLLRTIERLPGHHTQFVFTHRRVNGAIDRGQESAIAGEPWASGSSASQKVTDWRAEAIEAGLKGIENIGPKKLVAYVNRHAYASEAVSSGYTIEHTAELLGNTPAVTASTYSHSIDDAAAERAREFVTKRRKGAGRK